MGIFVGTDRRILGRKALLAISLFTLLVAAGTLISCSGFFVDPTVSAITVTPTNASISVGSTQQLSAVATYSDGSAPKVIGSATWTTSNAADATVSTTGLVTAVSAGTAPPASVTITATSGAVSGSTTVSITTAALQSITITSVPSPATISKTSGSTVLMAATGNYADNTMADITTSVNWVSSDVNVVTVTNAGLVTAATNSVAGNTATITATSGTITSNTITVTINQ